MRATPKRGKKNPFEFIVPYKIDVDLIGDYSNHVLIEVFLEDVKKTVGGIITEGIEDRNFAGFATRRGRVIKSCSQIFIAENYQGAQMHECDVEIMVDDIVYIDHNVAWNSYMFTDDNKRIMRLIPYSSIQLAVRNGDVIMCNGFILYEKVEREKKYFLNGKPIELFGNKYIENQGIVKYVGSLNKRYHYPGDVFRMNRTDVGTEKLKPGDRFLIENPNKTWDLENWAFAIFDNRKIYKVIRRHNISAIYPS